MGIKTIGLRISMDELNVLQEILGPDASQYNFNDVFDIAEAFHDLLTNILPALL